MIRMHFSPAVNADGNVVGKKKKKEMLQYVTNDPEGTLIHGCDLEHSQGTRVLHRM